MRPTFWSHRRSIGYRLACGAVGWLAVAAGFAPNRGWTQSPSAADSAPGRPSADSLLPDTTKGFLSIPSFERLRTDWKKTAPGRMFQDPLMKPFREDLRRQIDEKLSQTESRLGIKWEDLEGVSSGEVSLASLQPEGKTSHALALVVDVLGREKHVDELLAKIDQNMARRRAKKSVSETGRHTIVGYVVPPSAKELEENDRARPRNAFYCRHREFLVASDHNGVLSGILGRLDGAGTATLGQLKPYLETLRRCREASPDGEPHVRWYLEPFGYAEVVQSIEVDREDIKKRDTLRILSDDGFDVIQGIGGFLFLATADHDVLERTFVYAPTPPGLAEASNFRLGARVLEFANRKSLAPSKLVPADVSSYLTANWNMRDAFFHSKTLVNGLAGDQIFDDVIDSIRDDPNGPQVDIRKDLIPYLGDRASLLTKYRAPTAPDSEQQMFLIELRNSDAAAKTVNQAMSRDPGAEKTTFGDHIVWRIQDVEEPGGTRPGDGFGRFRGDRLSDDEDEKFFKEGAIAVAHGHLIYASDVEFVHHLLRQADQARSLGDDADYTRVQDALQKLGAGDHSIRMFRRGDPAHLVNYEMFRQGKMPESTSFMARLLNRMFEPAERGVVRKQEFDGSKLPPFEKIRHYLGVSGMFVTTDDDGWLVTGCLLPPATR